MSSERLLKPREFCSLVGISYQTFKRWVCEGRIAVVRTPTGRIRVPYSVVESILKEQARIGEVKEVRAVSLRVCTVIWLNS